jgi:hypothetical protein
MRDHASSILLFIIHLQIVVNTFIKQKKLCCPRRESGGIAPIILDLGTRRRVSDQFHAPGGWVGLRAYLDVSNNIILLCLSRNEPRTVHGGRVEV